MAAPTSPPPITMASKVVPGAPAGAAQAEEDAAVLRAVGAVYFGVFVPFVVRALAEGVYGQPVADAVGELVAEVRKEWDEVFPAEAEES